MKVWVGVVVGEVVALVVLVVVIDEVKVVLVVSEDVGVVDVVGVVVGVDTTHFRLKMPRPESEPPTPLHWDSRRQSPSNSPALFLHLVQAPAPPAQVKAHV